MHVCTRDSDTGTYLRYTAINAVVRQFARACAAAGKHCQIVVLGAGSDTRYFQLGVGHVVTAMKSYFRMKPYA